MTEESGEPAAVAFPSEESLARKVESHKRSPNVARVVSSTVSGCATLFFGIGTAFCVTAAIAGSIGAGVFIPVMAAGTVGFAFLTWRWARGLPPYKQIATDQERDELE